MLTLPHALAIGFVAVAAVVDLRRQRIPNWTTYPGIVAGLAANTYERGIEGLEDAIVGFAVLGGLMLVCFVLFAVGGGDVKLLAMMGAFLGLERGVEAMLWTFVIGSIAAVAVLIWRIGAARIASKTIEHARLVLRARRWIPLTEKEREPLKRTLYLAPSALVAVCVVLANAEYRWFSGRGSRVESRGPEVIAASHNGTGLSLPDADSGPRPLTLDP
ncbi:MAG: A24 family peptidase [Planctomycetes bacterium]|nr:A24 family peptidase [Planctomycetota bacterium]